MRKNFCCSIGIHNYKLISRKTTHLSEFARKLTNNLGTFRTFRIVEKYECINCNKSRKESYLQ